MKAPVHVAVTGAAGQISYSLLFRIASGDFLGPDQPICLHLLEITPALGALEGAVMELNDFAFLVGARPRGPGMERKDLLEANAAIFSVQGKALNKVAKRDVRVLVVGNPANTNALIAMNNAPDLDPRNFTAMTRLDHNRAMSLLAEKTGNHNTDVTKMTIWGNHSATQYPDLHNCLINGEDALSKVDASWYADDFIPAVQQRGAAIIKARGLSSAASAASSALDHRGTWGEGAADGDWVSMGIPSDGSYGIEEGLIYSFPVTVKDGDYSIVQGLEINDFSRERMIATENELKEERDGVKHLL